MSSCPAPQPTLSGEGRIYPLIVSALYPAYIVGGVCLFIYYRKTSVFLRRRPLNFILITAIGALMGWAVITLRTVLGNEAFPCWLTMLLFYSAPPLVKGTLVLKDAQYLTEVHAIRMGREMASAREQSMRQSNASGINFDGEGLDLVGSDASLSTFAAHMRTIFRCKRRPDDRLKNLRFTRSPVFVVFWMSMVFLPGLLSFAIRMAQEPTWQQNCYGCDISYTDRAVTLGLFVTGGTVGNFVHSKKISSKDALRITLETRLCWRVTIFSALGMLLFLIDPGQLYANGYFNWLEIVQLDPFLVAHLQTVHQVVMARRSHHRLLTAQDINREERFVDVQSNKELRQAFRAHLDSELSPEIYLFMDAAEKYRSNYEKYKDGGRFKQAETIMTMFIDRRAKLEVNISSRIRERISASFNLGATSETVPQNLFDEAYAEVREHLLNDGFARFLEKVGPMLMNKTKFASTRSLGGTTPKSLGASPSPRSAPNTPMSMVSVQTPGSQKETPTGTTKMVTFSFSDDEVARNAASDGSTVNANQKSAAVGPEEV